MSSGNSGGFFGNLNNTGTSAQIAQRASGSVTSFFSSLVGGVVVAAIEVAVFLLLKEVLPRIYRPRTFLVPERERVAVPGRGVWSWATSVFRISNSEFIEKCGLDAYFFLRYLRMLLKIFIPLTLILGPILLCLNAIGGKGDDFAVGIYSNSTAWANVTGINQLAWGNVRPTETNRYWGHCICAIIVVVWCCYVFYDELGSFVRLRQAYLSSPQHRLRASATTVLVSAIPRKWCTDAALRGLYDVYPGGIRNIWINRNFDELQDKVNRRDGLARALEAAETDLIMNAKKAQLKQAEKEAKKAGLKKTKEQKKQDEQVQNEKAAAIAEAGVGQSTNNPHQDLEFSDEELKESRSNSADNVRRNPLSPTAIPVVGKGLEVVGAGITGVGKALFGGIRSVGRGVENTVNTTHGLDTNVNAASDDDLTLKASFPSPINGLNTNNNNISQHDGATSSFQVDEDEAGDEHIPSGRDVAKAANHHQDQHTFGQEPKNELSRPVSAASDHIVHTVPLHGPTRLAPWRKGQNEIQVPAPYPHGYKVNGDPSVGTRPPPKKFWQFWRDENEPEEYPDAYKQDYDQEGGTPVWEKYLKAKDRDTMRLPIGGIDALSFLGWIGIGEKVDTIDYCRKELARLNLEIKQDQAEPEKYPLMNSAFIQFNHQVAAHMACQSVAHHTPLQMAPRVIEIAPSDVIWSNMSLKWWERWLRTVIVVIVVFWLIVGWAVPVAFTGVLSNIQTLEGIPWLNWVSRLPGTVLNIISGILPAALLAILLLLLPIVLRALTTAQGVPTGTAVELEVQWYYFVFLFVQVFLIVTLSSSIPTIVSGINASISIDYFPSILATNLPLASNYFFNYMFLQACSTSAGVLAQVGSLISWYIFGLFDTTARDKWSRQVSLPTVQWGTFFPVYTNFACIGLIYCTVAPLMLVFLLITFTFFWFVYRYQTLYVTQFKQDTGGLLFPRAINQLFVGLYVMELCLFGLFLLVQEVNPNNGQPTGSPCQGQAIVMIIVLVLTAIYQALLNHSFGPLLQYLPITLEDDAVIRDEEFARAQDKRLNLGDPQDEGEDVEHALEAKQRRWEEADEAQEAADEQDIEQRRSRGLHRQHLNPLTYVPGRITKNVRGAWRDQSRSQVRGRSPSASRGQTKDRRKGQDLAGDLRLERLMRMHRLRAQARHDREAGPNTNDAIAQQLFGGINDEIEDLLPEERDLLIRRAFQHEALRSRPPCIWIPRDDLGVSADEIKRTQEFTENIWISDNYTSLDAKGKVVFRRNPPDFLDLDLISL